jgi:DNA-binding FadR family transcriptional regulator
MMDLLAESRDRYLQVEGRPEKSLARHKQVLEAIRAGNKDLAAQVMHEHLEDIEASLFEDANNKKTQKTTGKGGRKSTVL